MEPNVENREEQDLRQRHRERIERMRREKEKQERWRRTVRKYWPFGIAGFAGLMVAVVCLSAGKNEASEMIPQPGTEQLVEEPGSVGMGDDATQNVYGDSGNTLQGDVTSQTEMDGTQNPLDVTSNDRELGVNQEEPANSEEVSEDSTLYTFEETQDTITIYNENVLSSNVILVDETTDEIIASRGARERISPASMTKVLTVLVAAEQIEEEKLDDTFVITLEYTDYAYVNDCSTAGFLKDEEVTVRDLFYGTILPSGGEAAVALASYTAGSHEAFVELMNEKLDELGLSESAHFTNSVGLYDEEHYCTVYDMAVIMKAALQNELCREVLTSRTYTTAPTQQHPEGILLSNWFLRRIEDKETAGRVIGAKTGFVAQSQSCAVSYGIFDDNPYICVTTGSSSSWNCINDHVEIYNCYVPRAQEE